MNEIFKLSFKDEFLKINIHHNFVYYTFHKLKVNTNSSLRFGESVV